MTAHHSDPAPASGVPWRQDARTIGLIGLAHGSSHFFHLLLPPLFPFFIRDFGLSYAELGLLVTVFFVVSGIGQALGGFVVDRCGARPVLFGAMGCFVLAGLAAAAAQGYGGLMLASALAGLGNAPFHPADFTILNKRVSQPRLGHAFSVHGITGNLGWAVAPVFLAGLQSATGSWRLACAGAAGLAALVLVVMLWQREAIDDRQGAWAHQQAGAARPAAHEHPLAFLKLASVWLCFSFFFWTTVTLGAIQSFAGPALQQLYGLPLSLSALVVTGYMLSGAAGLVLGGFILARTQRLERVIALGMAASAAALLLVGSGWLPGLAALLLAAVAGVGAGLAGPSRDMLIKRAAPPGATGRVYGVVYSGFDVGFAIAAPLLGRLMDAGHSQALFFCAAGALLAAVACAALVGRSISARQRLERLAAGGAAAKMAA